jgi:hypothetical protein
MYNEETRGESRKEVGVVKGISNGRGKREKKSWRRREKVKIGQVVLGVSSSPYNGPANQ